MSQENVEIWRANLEALLAQLAAGTEPEATISTLAEIWDPEVELDATDAAALDLNRVYLGADAARQFWQEWFSAWETLSFEYELVDAGERILMLVDMRMRGRSTGIDVPFGKFAWVSTFRDGLVVHVKLYMSQSEALEAVGLSEEAMSQENVEVVRRMNAAFNGGDLDAAFEFYEPEAVWHSRTDEPDTGEYRGRAAIQEMAAMWRGLFDDFRLELEHYADARDCVVASGWVCGRGRESGAEVRDPYAWVIRMRNGKLSEIWEYGDRAEALEAVGLSE